MVTPPVVRPWIDPYLRGDGPLLTCEADFIDREFHSCGPGGRQQCLLPEGKAEHANRAEQAGRPPAVALSDEPHLSGGSLPRRLWTRAG